MPCVRSRPSDCGRTCRSHEVAKNERMASRATARPSLNARTLPHNRITRNKCWLETLTLHGSPSRPRLPASMASVSPTLGPFLPTKFSIVVNIDQPRIGVWGKTSSIAAPNRQLSATERSVMLPPNTGEHHVIYPTKSTIQPRGDRNSSVFQVWQAYAVGLHRACSTRS